MNIYDIKRIIANDENKSVGLPEPEYGTDGSFVWITFKRPNPDTYSDTYLDTYLDTNLDNQVVTSHVSNSVTNSVAHPDTNPDNQVVTNLNPDTNPDNQKVTGSDYKMFLTDKQKEVVAYCIIPRSSREILEHIDVTYQNRNIMRFITTLIENGYLVRTIPDSPYSPLQKYVAIRRVM